MINDVLVGYIDVFILVFLDDILVYSRTMEEHAKHLQKAFVALKKHRLISKASKCSIMVRDVEFVSQWIVPKGASPLKEKLRVVCNWERPQTVRDVRSFLEFANSYCHFISKYTEVA